MPPNAPTLLEPGRWSAVLGGTQLYLAGNTRIAPPCPDTGGKLEAFGTAASRRKGTPHTCTPRLQTASGGTNKKGAPCGPKTSDH